MTIARRYDTSSLGQAERTPQGGLRIPARFTRVGVLLYRNPDGTTRRELRPPDEVFDPESMASLRAAPVTNLHVDQISTSNYSNYSKGHVGDDVVRDDIYLGGHVYVQDAAMVSMVEGGQRKEVSLGYEALIDPTPGTFNGEPYDVVQRRIRYNHAALGPEGWGRAGSEVCLRLDGGGDGIPPGTEDGRIEAPGAPGDDRMKIEIIRGTEYEVGTPAHTAAVKRRDSEVEDLQAEIKAKEEELAALKAKAAKLADENEGLKAEATETETKMDARVQALAVSRSKLLSAARDLGVEVKTDAADHELRVALLGKLAPASRFDAKSTDAAEVARATTILDHLLDTAAAAKGDKSVRELAHTIVQGRRDAATEGLGSKVEKAQAEDATRRRDAWKTKAS